MRMVIQQAAGRWQQAVKNPAAETSALPFNARHAGRRINL
jgi:hypothetical protein